MQIDQPDAAIGQLLPLDEREHLIVGCAGNVWQVQQVIERPSAMAQRAAREFTGYERVYRDGIVRQGAFERGDPTAEVIDP